jgi:hypothetical protein
MFRFNKLNEKRKIEYKSEINRYISIFGGVNFFLREIEKIRYSKSSPLMNSHCKYNNSLISLTWNKSIFKSKVLLLKDSNFDIGENLIPLKEDKRYKTKINLLKSLKPLRFEVTFKNEKHNNFSFPIYNNIDNDDTSFNPNFVILFFASVFEIKKIIKYS